MHPVTVHLWLLVTVLQRKNTEYLCREKKSSYFKSYGEKYQSEDDDVNFTTQEAKVGNIGIL